MLSRLHVSGLALLSDVSLELGPGLTVLTGETGAGKSLLVSAIGLLRGARGRAGVVREGCEEARVEASLQLAGTEGRPHALKLARTLRRDGKSRCWIDEEVVSLGRLAEVGGAALGLCGQHSYQDLGGQGPFLRALDALAAQEPSAHEYGARYAAWCREASAFVERRRAVEAARSERERLTERLAELTDLAVFPGEYEELEQRLAVLRRASGYSTLAERASDVLVEREGSVERQLRDLLREFGKSVPESGPVQSLWATLVEAQGAVGEAARAAARLREALDVEPGVLEELEQRYARIGRAAHAFGVAPSELSTLAARLPLELERLLEAEREVGDREARVSALEAEARSLAELLHEGRERVVAELGRRVESELASLCLPGARLALSLTQREELGPNGISQLEVAFAANPGEPLGPIAAVASGGELSRLLVALWCAGVQAGAETLIFDEVDAGVGGVAADALGDRLRNAARERQILCITHHAAVAARADQHFRISKEQVEGRTHTRAVRLSKAERVEELSRMLSGNRAVRGARSLARQLLEETHAKKRSAA